MSKTINGEQTRLQVVAGVVEGKDAKLVFAGANTCEEGGVLRNEYEIEGEYFFQDSLKLGSLFGGIESVSNHINGESSTQEICFNFVGIGDHDMSGINEKHAENKNFIKKFLDGTGIGFDSLPKNHGRDGFDDVSLTVLIGNGGQQDETRHRGRNEINIIKNMAKVLHNDLKPETKDKIKKFSEQINKKFPGLKINDIITVSDEARKSEAYLKGDGVDFDAGEGTKYSDVFGLYKECFGESTTKADFDDCFCLLAKTDYDGGQEFDADDFENAYRQQHSHALLFKSSNESVIENMENLERSGEKIKNIEDFQRLHYIQCVIYGVMCSVEEEEPKVRVQIWNNIQSFLDDFQRDQLPQDYGSELSEKEFVNVVTKKLLDGTEVSKDTEIVNKYIATFYSIVKEPEEPSHVTQICALQIDNKNEFIQIDGAYLIARDSLENLQKILKQLINQKQQTQKPLVVKSRKKSVALPSIGASLSGLVLSVEGVAAVFLFGLENNAVKVAFNVVKGALTLPGLGFLAGVVTVGSSVALIFLSKKTKDNSKYNDSLIKNGGSGEPPKVK